MVVSRPWDNCGTGTWNECALTAEATRTPQTAWVAGWSFSFRTIHARGATKSCDVFDVRQPFLNRAVLHQSFCSILMDLFRTTQVLMRKNTDAYLHDRVRDCAELTRIRSFWVLKEHNKASYKAGIQMDCWPSLSNLLTAVALAR